MDQIDEIKQRLTKLENELLQLENSGKDNVRMIQIKGEIDALLQ